MSHETLIKIKGLKTTPARKRILELFSGDCEPINADYIYSKLKSKDINQVTVYRTLTSFEEAGIIRRVDLRRNSVFYELSEHHHHHVICMKCGMTEGFESCDIDAISKEFFKKSSQFKTIEQHSLELFGMCKSCAKR